MIANVRLIEPAPLVAHEVAHSAPTAVVGCSVEKGKRPVQDRRPALIGVTAIELQGYDRQARNVVDAVAGFSVWDRAAGVLHDADVIDECADVVGSGVPELQLDDGNRRPARRERYRLTEHGRGHLGYGRPGDPLSDPASLCSRSRQRLGLLHEFVYRLGKRVRVSERHDPPGSRLEDVLRIPVGGRDSGTAGGDREGECARGDLFGTAVWSDEDVGSEQVGQLVDRKEAVVELDVIAEPEIDDATLEHQPVLLALSAHDLRVRAPRDQVQNLGVTLDNRRQRLDRRLEALTGRYQAEAGEQKA